MLRWITHRQYSLIRMSDRGFQSVRYDWDGFLSFRRDWFWLLCVRYDWAGFNRLIGFFFNLHEDKFWFEVRCYKERINVLAPFQNILESGFSLELVP
jgi:hypothetical protein